MHAMRRWSFINRYVVILLAGPALVPIAANATASLFEAHCAVCHTLTRSEPSRQGPSLENIIGRKAGAIEGFPYSSSMKALGFSWNAQNLDRWLIEPQKLASDSYMMYRQPDPEIRRSIIAYLQSLQ